MTSNPDDKPRPVSFPNVDDYEWNSRWLQIEAERAGIPSVDVGEQPPVTPDDEEPEPTH